jgi:hypothetical protein
MNDKTHPSDHLVVNAFRYFLVGMNGTPFRRRRPPPRRAPSILNAGDFKGLLGSTIAAACMILTACSGGGGGAADTTRPAVSSTSPASGATSVATSAAVTATFDEDILGTSVSTGSFTLADSQGPVAGAVTFDGASDVATFTPSQSLSLLSTYTATLTTAIDNLSGNGLATDYTWRFTTRDGAWQTPQLIEANDGDAVTPQIAFDPAGNALAVWSQFDGTRFSIWANRYTAGAGWGSAELIETDDAGDAAYPEIAVDHNGNALAVWQQSDGARNNIWANRYTAGSGWGSAALIETDNAGPALHPQVAFDPDGNALAVWYQSDGSRYNIVANRYTAGTGWGSAELIETVNSGSAEFPQIAVDASGNALAVWYQYDGTRNNIWANRYNAGSGWGSAELIETDNAGPAINPQIAVDAAGNALAVWSQSDGAIYYIWANRYTVGSGWGSPELIETYNTGDAFSPQIAFDVAGNALAVWEQSDGVGARAAANRYTAGSGWGSAEIIDISTPGNSLGPQIAVDGAGNALAVWYETTASRNDIWANRYTAGSGWGSPAVIETDDTGDAIAPEIAVDATGNALAVWYQYDGARNNIVANRFE